MRGRDCTAVRDQLKAETELVILFDDSVKGGDVRKLVEFGESLGIPVLGWQTTTLPRFYTGTGGPPVSATVATASEAAELATTHWRLAGHSGLLLARRRRLLSRLGRRRLRRGRLFLCRRLFLRWSRLGLLRLLCLSGPSKKERSQGSSHSEIQRPA